jgi:hypothetical protein
MADNAKSAKPGGTPNITPENTSQRQRMAQGMDVTGQKAPTTGGKKTRP